VLKVPQREKKVTLLESFVVFWVGGAGQVLFSVQQGEVYSKEGDRTSPRLHCLRLSLLSLGPEVMRGAWAPCGLSQVATEKWAGDAFGGPPLGSQRGLPQLSSLRLAFSSLTPRPH
jgi:hypothetical protein